MPLSSSNDDIQEKLTLHHFSTGAAPTTEQANPPDPFPSITTKEVATAIRSLNPNKAPGTDKIDPRLVKLIFDAVPELYVNAINKSLSLGYFTES